jgi:cell division protein FtsB
MSRGQKSEKKKKKKKKKKKIAARDHLAEILFCYLIIFFYLKIVLFLGIGGGPWPISVPSPSVS